MRVIQCADYGGPYAGSFVPMLAAAAREAGHRGYPTTIVLSEIARGRPWLADLDGLAEVRFAPAGGSRLAGIRPAMRELKALLDGYSGPVVIHTHFARFDIPAALMRLPRRRLAVFWHEHTALSDDRRVRLRNVIRYVCLGRLVSGMLCVSPELRAELRARHAPKRKLYDFPNAIDARSFSPITESERSAARRSLGLPERARVVLHFGWDWHIKGGDLMLAAARMLESEADLVILTVVGEDAGPIAGLDGSAIVRPLAPRNDVRNLYAAADVFLSCSSAEGGMPLAVLEALACGLPLVATDIPVQARLLAGLPGVATVTSDPAAIASGIREMLALGEAERAAQVGLARARIGSYFALDEWARRLVDLYEAALDGRS
jgi:glycosyltransferase involved in cell wall biosynthesis